MRWDGGGRLGGFPPPEASAYEESFTHFTQTFPQQIGYFTRISTIFLCFNEILRVPVRVFHSLWKNRVENLIGMGFYEKSDLFVNYADFSFFTKKDLTSFIRRHPRRRR